MTKESEIIGYFARGQKQAMATGNLRLEYTDTSIRLSNNNAILIGISKQVNKWQRKVLISNNSSYKDSIVNILVEIGFINRRKSSHPEFSEYHSYQVPEGYKLNYTEVIQLWRNWWHSKRYQLNIANSPIDISVFHKGKWHSLTDLQPKQGSFIILTAKGEIEIEPEEYIVWIDRVTTTVTSKSSDVVQKDYINRLAEPDEYTDLEAYLSTFNTEDSEDIDRIEGIYNINELLGDSSVSNISPPLAKFSAKSSEETVTNPAPKVDSSVESSVNSKLIISTPIDSSFADSQRQAVLKLKAMGVLETYLREGDVIVHTEVLKNAQGQEISRKVIKIKRDCPSWAIEQIKKIPVPSSVN